MAKRETRLPTLTTLESIKEALDVRLGRRGDPMDRAVTLRDVVDSGLPVSAVREAGGFSLQHVAPVGRFVPPPPQGLTALSIFGGIHILWDRPLHAEKLAFTELSRSTSNDVATRQVLTSAGGFSYLDMVDSADEQTYFYWVRFMSTTGQYGPYEGPVSAVATPLVSDTIERLTGKLNEDVLTPAFAERLDGFTETLDEMGERYTVTLNNNGHVSGYTNYNTGEESVFAIQADTFVVANEEGETRAPFLVQDGSVYMNTVFIREASIQEGKLGPITIGKLVADDGTPVTTVAGLLRADMIDVNSLRIGFGQVTGNLSSSARGNNGRPVWLLDRNGGFELNSNAAGGSMEQRGDRISVYDGNGRLRVRIGRL